MGAGVGWKSCDAVGNNLNPVDVSYRLGGHMVTVGWLVVAGLSSDCRKLLMQQRVNGVVLGNVDLH